jgi:hypothetical protein
VQEQRIAADDCGGQHRRRHHSGGDLVDPVGKRVLCGLLALQARQFQKMVIGRALLDIA